MGGGIGDSTTIGRRGRNLDTAPAHRIVSFDVEPTDDSKGIVFEVWEVKEDIRVENIMPPNSDKDDDEDEEEEK